MGSIPDSFPISLRSWPPNSAKQVDLSTFISRVNVERGGLRMITEESLRAEIAAEEASDLEVGSPATLQDEEDAGEGKSDRANELQTARGEVLAHIEQAHQSVLFSLDFVSLLLSKHTPAQAGLTISPFLRDAVGMGTLGMDKLHGAQNIEARREDTHVAKGWKFQSLNQAADAVLASAARLERDMELEIKYWEQILAVSEAGWPICRMPDERHVLGVRFGFPESAASFQSRSPAALRRNIDGSAYLDQGTLRKLDPQSLRVRISTDGTESGCSSVAIAVTDDAPVEHIIKQARNTLFVAELWQELNRESRSLSSWGVEMKNGMIFYKLTPTKTMVIDVVPIGNTCNPPVRADDNLAESLSVALHLMLCFSHRHVHQQRTLPPQPLSGEDPQPPSFYLLRPVVTRQNHELMLSELHALFHSLDAIMASTRNHPLPVYRITRKAPKLTQPHQPTAETVVRSLTDSLEATTQFSITPTTSITVRSKTEMVPISGTTHIITLSNDSSLKNIFPPPSGPPAEPMWEVSQVKDYVTFAIGCALAASFESLEPVVEDSPFQLKPDPDQKQTRGLENWLLTSQPHILRKTFAKSGRNKQISFMVHEQVHKQKNKRQVKEFQLKVVWEWMGSVLVGRDNWDEERTRERGEGAYVWSEYVPGDWEDVKEGEVVRSLEEIVEAAGKADCLP